jgi:large subunit ribosomal protein L4
MPRKQRQAALRSTILGKVKDDELHVVSGLTFAEPKTKNMVAFLEGHGLTGETVLVATDGLKRNVFLSGRNIPGVNVLPAQELNARRVLVHKHLVIEQTAFERLNAKVDQVKHARKPKGSRKRKAEVAAAGEQKA